MKPLVFASKQTWINGCSLFIPPKMLLKGWIHSQMALFAGGQADLPGASSDFGTPAGNPWVLPCFTPQERGCEDATLSAHSRARRVRNSKRNLSRLDHGLIRGSSDNS